MKNEFLPYDRALKLKQLGFDEPCFARFNNDGDLLIAHTEKYIIDNGVDRSEFFTLAPLFQQASRWFREIHGLDSFCRQQTTNGHSYWKISKLNTQDKVLGYSNFTNTYEEAELACLDKLIEIVETNQQEQ